MSEPLVRWLIEIGKDPSIASQCHEDLEARMEAAGLSQQEKEIVRTRDLVRVRNYLAIRREENRKPIVVNIGF